MIGNKKEKSWNLCVPTSACLKYDICLIVRLILSLNLMQIFYILKESGLLFIMMLILYIFLCLYQPQSKDGVNSFGGLGATLIDSLDTLYIMGLDEQFQRARE